MNNLFFKPTPLYKEFMILDMIEKDTKITQRRISDELGISVSMVNSYLESYENKGYIKRKYISAKIVEYNITSDGIHRKKILNITYLNSAQKLYNSAKENIMYFLDQILIKGFKNILLYGAGEVAELLLQTIFTDKNIDINILAIIDDDESKQGKKLGGSKIISFLDIEKYPHDGILISSLTNKDKIIKKLLLYNYNMNKILQFLD